MWGDIRWLVVMRCVWLSISLQAIQVAAISKISAVGAKFFNEEGKQFFIKGSLAQ
jgi:hypothetical protein